ncbi:MAG: ATP-binding protein, partial [Acidobacteriota bacterium]
KATRALIGASDDLEEQIALPLNVKLQIYRIAQEVLTNINRHSSADLVEMDVELSEDKQFLLTIRDNGKPFQPDGNSTKGRGIANIRSRANLINAKIAWDERPEGGNIFSLEIAG